MIASWLPLIAVPFLGWLAGAAVNFLADWLPSRGSKSPLQCTHCGAAYALWHYALWWKHCPACGQPRGKRTWIVVLLSIPATLFIWYYPPATLNFVLGYITLIYLGVVIVIDIEHRVIPTPLLLAGMILGIIVGFARNGLALTLLGGLTGLFLVYFLYLLGILFRKVWGKFKQMDSSGPALGLGDVFLSGVLGLMVGWPNIVTSLLLAILFAGAFSLAWITFMVLKRVYTPGRAFPYSPFIILVALGFIF